MRPKPQSKGFFQPIDPVEASKSDLEVLFEGRLDNRPELLRELGLQAVDSQSVSDTLLAAEAYRKWGSTCFERFLGPFAMVVRDRAAQRLVAGRDPLGDRTLCYHLGSNVLVIGTQPSAVLRHPAVTSRLDEVTLSHFFAVEAPPSGSTFFADVRELPPGHTLVYDRQGLHMEPFWSPASLPPIRYRDDRQYVDHFRALLTESIRCRMPSTSVPAVLMSGGLDSTSVAALAAGELAKAQPEARLPVVSWVFDELTGADERPFMDPMIERFSLEAHRIHGDEDWPLRDLPSWPIHPDAPSQGLYCRLQNKAYEATKRNATTVLLTGEYGDHLFCDSALWLRGLLAEGRWAESWRALRQELGSQSLSAALRGSPIRGAVARTLGLRPRHPARAWLTATARRHVEGEPVGEPLGGTRRRRQPGALDPRCAHNASLEVANARRAGIEVRRPFRDRRLIEFVLSIPAHLLYRPGWSKWILRQAMTGILPESVRLRRHVSSLLPLAARGLVERESVTVHNLLSAPEALWRRYVRADWLAAVFPHRLRQRQDGIEAVVPWQCLCGELWTQREGLQP
ncbi:MAG: asparagine synthase-related protein [Acidobacteriota bacterium]